MSHQKGSLPPVPAHFHARPQERPPDTKTVPPPPSKKYKPAAFHGQQQEHTAVEMGYLEHGTTPRVAFTPQEHVTEITRQKQDNISDSESDSGGDSISVSSSGLTSISNAPSIEHFNISFEFRKTFREHQGARVFKSYKGVLKTVYNKTLSWTYNTVVFSVGILLVIFWGLINAITAFLQSWFLSPVLRVSLVVVRGVLPLILEPCGLCLKTCVAACCGGKVTLPSALGGGGLSGGSTQPGFGLLDGFGARNQ